MLTKWMTLSAPEIADRCRPFFETLLECFEQLEFVPVTKGQHLEKLRRKLAQLARNDKANEIVPGDILEIANKVTNR